MGKRIDTKNIKVRQILVTDLSQQLKKQREFLKWMARRYEEVNSDQAAAFRTGAEKLDEIREELLAGDYDLPGTEELLTSQQQLDQLFDLEDLK